MTPEHWLLLYTIIGFIWFVKMTTFIFTYRAKQITSTWMLLGICLWLVIWPVSMGDYCLMLLVGAYRTHKSRARAKAFRLTENIYRSGRTIEETKINQL